jgi:hypothetical protein
MLIAMLSTLAVGVLLVACGNVAGLLTSRAPVRAREMALRLAIGAGRGRLVRQLVTESLIVAILGGALGLAVGYAGMMLFRQIEIPTDLPIMLAFRMDRRALVFSLARRRRKRRHLWHRAGNPGVAHRSHRHHEGGLTRSARDGGAAGDAPSWSPDRWPFPSSCWWSRCSCITAFARTWPAAPGTVPIIC